MNKLLSLAALLLTVASQLATAQDTFGVLTNNFYISNPGSVTTSLLLTPGSGPARTVLTAYTNIAKARLGSYSGFSGKNVKYGNYKIATVSQTTCPAGAGTPTGHICHYISCSLQVNYTRADFGTPPGTAAVQYIQDSINTGGNLDCAFKAVTPTTVITSRTGGQCPGRSPTRSPASPPTPVRAPTRAPVIQYNTVATITNNFVISNSALIPTARFNDPTTQAYKQIAAAYQSLVKKSLASYSIKGLTYTGAATLGIVTSATCPSTTPSLYLCNAVPTSSKFTYIASNFSTPPALGFVNYVQTAINNGKLDCELKALYPGTPIKITTGGGCKN